MNASPTPQPQQGQTQYYCHECSTRTSQPMREPELHCPNCGSGAIEEQESIASEMQSPFSGLFGGQGMPLGGAGMFGGMPTVLIRGHPQQQQQEQQGETQGEGQEGNSRQQPGQGNSIMNLFSSFFGTGPRPQQPRRGAAPLGQGRGTTFTFTAGPSGPSFTRTSYSTQPAHTNPNDDPPDAEPQTQSQVPVRSLSDFLQHAFNGPPQPPSNETRPEQPEQPRQPDLAQALFSMLGGMASAERGGQTPQERPSGRVFQGPGFSFFVGTNTGQGTRVGFPGQFGDFVFNENALDNVINMLMQQAGGHEGPRPAPEEMIRDLPRQSWTEELKTTAPITDCAVCKDDFENEDVTLALPCRHVFHESCITPWLERSGTCPVCRHQLVEQPEAHPIAQGAMPGQTAAPPAAAPTRQPPSSADVEMDGLD